MSQTYPLPLPSLQLLISNIDRTAELEARSLVIHTVLGPQIDSCAFKLKSPESYRGTATTKPTVGQSMQVLVQTSPTASFSPVYTGIISRVGEVKIAFKTVAWNVECVDNTHLLTRLLVVRNYQDQLISDMVLDIAKRYCGGIDTSGVQTTHGRTVQSITFSYKSPLDCFEELAGLIGYQWFVDPLNVLYFYDPTSTLRVSAQSITDTSNNFDELTIEPQLDQIRNRVYVTGGIGQSATILETFALDGRIDTFKLLHNNINSPNIGMTADGKLGDFMTLSGASYGGAAVNQLTATTNIGDMSQLSGGWLVDVGLGVVMRSIDTAIPPDGTTARFKYQFKTPINVVQQSTASMQAVAQLESTDYITVVSGDAPLYWWRLNDVSGTTAWSRGTQGVQVSGAYSGNYTLNFTGPLIYDTTSRSAEFHTDDDQMLAPASIPPAGYALECWAQLPALSSSNNTRLFTGIPTASRPAIGLNVFGYYTFRSGTDTLIATAQPNVGRFDHIVAQYVSGSGMIYVNNILVGGPTAMATSSATTSALTGTFTTGPSCRIAEAAVYSGGLSTTQIGEHYFAGKYGGIREHALTVNGETSYDACMQQANAELDKYSAVITKLTWTSYAPTWQVGDTVTVNVTSANLGRTFNDTALIQEVIMRWFGPQRFQYEVMCVSTRYNPLDHARALAAPRDPIVPNSEVAGLVLMTTFTEDTAIIIDGPVTHTIA